LEFDDKHTRLLIGAKNGDSEAFDDLQRSLEKVVRDFTISLDGSLDSADRDDVVQEVFLKLFEQLHNYREESSAKTYVLSIAKNVVRQKLSKRNRIRKIHIQDVEDIENHPNLKTLEPDFELKFLEFCEAIERAKAQLTDKQRQAVELVFQDGLSVSDATELIGCSYKTFRRRLDLARQKMRDDLKGFDLVAIGGF